MASSAAAKLLKKRFGGRSSSNICKNNLGWLRRMISDSSAAGRQFEHPFLRPRLSEPIPRPSRQDYVSSAVFPRGILNAAICRSTLGRLHNGNASPDVLSGDALAGQEHFMGRSHMTFSRMAHSNAKTPDTSQSARPDHEFSEDKTKTAKKSLGSRILTLLSGLEEVPAAALGLGLAGAIPFVGLTPGIATLLPLPALLSSIHIEAQAAYGAVILTFLGGPHWGLAMTDYGRPSASSFSRHTVQNFRYIWSVVPSLVAWPALLLDPVPKFALLITSFGVVLGVDAAFARLGLVPSWYMPLRVLLTGIAMLSMTSSLIVTAAAKVTLH